MLVFNPLSWARTDEVEFEAQFPAPVKEVWAIGSGWSSDARLESSATMLLRAAYALRLLAENIPATGYKLLRLETSPTAFQGVGRSAFPGQAIPLPPPPIRWKTNSFVSRSIPRPAASPASLTSAATPKLWRCRYRAKARRRRRPDGLPCGNLLQAFVDKPKRWDAWNIDADFVKQHWDLMQADEVTLVENTPLRAVIRVKHHFQKSSFVQDITMYPGVPRVDVHMQADWHEQHILLKVAFPVERAQRQSDLRDSLWQRRAPHHAQYAGRAGAV